MSRQSRKPSRTRPGSDRFGASCGLSGRMWRGAAIGLCPWFVVFMLGLAWADHLQNNHTAVTAQSECEREASHGELLAWLGVEVPQCTADGSYNTTQCWALMAECFCADPQDGRLYYETETPRGEEMRHDCHVYWHTPHPATCHAGYTQSEDHCLKLYDLAQTWRGANSTCTADGGFLAAPKTEDLQQEVLKLLEDIHGGQYWIGLAKTEAGQWEWPDGAVPVFTAWAPGEPNNAGGREDCGELWKSGWNDAPCGNKRYFICQTEKGARSKCQQEAEDQAGRSVHDEGEIFLFCESDGTYRTLQCDGRDVCYCAHPRTGALFRETEHGWWDFWPEHDCDVYWMDKTEGPENQQYTGLGCWADTSDRAIPILEGTDPRLDGPYQSRQDAIQKCYQVAQSRGFTVFAVQNGGQCFGSANAFNTYNRYGPSTACAADGEGGPWANEVYQITEPQRWRADGRCGEGFPAPGGGPAECDPDGPFPCCSPYHYCGSSHQHCDCPGCTDYRLPEDPQETFDCVEGDGSTYRGTLARTQHPQGTYDCMEGDGSTYRGTLATTESGRTCQRWDAQWPHIHGFGSPMEHPELQENYCRNPDGEPTVWCYTTDPYVRWEHCELPDCDSIHGGPDGEDPGSPVDDCHVGDGSSYRGTADTTRSGQPCLPWDGTYGLTGNYCRNPDGEVGVWCFVDGPGVWELCDVPVCGEWLTRHSSWVVSSAGTPWVDNGVTYDAAKALDGDSATYWNPRGMGRNYNNWYIILDLTASHTVTRIALNNFGDTTHDIAAFSLQKSLSTSPYNWEEVVSVGNLQGGTNIRQEFGGFQGTARYWRFVVTQTHSGWQPWLSELDLYGTSGTGSGDVRVSQCAGSTTNIARGRSAQQSSQLYGKSAERAVDGNLDGDYYGNSCTHTDMDHQPWWRLDLGASKCVDRVVVTNRMDCCSDRLDGFKVYVGDDPSVSANPPCGEEQSAAGKETIPVACGGLTGRYVGIALPGWQYLTLCEVQVFGDDCLTRVTGSDLSYRWDLPPLTSSPFTFEVKAGSDVHIALSNQNSPMDDMYEIVIGGWENSMSVIRRKQQGDALASVATPDILSPYVYRGFLVSWAAGGAVSVRRQTEADPFLTWTDPDPLPVSHVGYSTGYGSTGTFIFCPHQGVDGETEECMEGDGETYRGNVARTVTGLVCQRWDSHSPHAHFAITPFWYPQSGLDGNFCRNPDGSGGPWCYTTDPDVRWEYCDVPTCDDGTGPGTGEDEEGILTHDEYRGFWLSWAGNGTVAVGREGETDPVLQWRDPDPVPVQHVGYSSGQGVRADFRFCGYYEAQRWRDDARCGADYPAPGATPGECDPKGPHPCCSALGWCGDTDRYCSCDGCVDYRQPKAPEQKDCQVGDGSTYRGEVAVTSSGRECQRWDSDYPHFTWFISPFWYPDSGLDQNYCRNPDGQSGVWCYTMDPDKEMELCGVPKCGDGSDKQDELGVPIQTSQVCEYEKMTLQCPGTRRLAIVHVLFGRTAAEPRCGGGGGGTYPGGGGGSYPGGADCRSPTAADAVRDRCQGRRACSVPADHTVFGDPCFGVSKYLLVKYGCVGEENSTGAYSPPDDDDISRRIKTTTRKTVDVAVSGTTKVPAVMNSKGALEGDNKKGSGDKTDDENTKPDDVSRQNVIIYVVIGIAVVAVPLGIAAFVKVFLCAKPVDKAVTPDPSPVHFTPGSGDATITFDNPHYDMSPTAPSYVQMKE
ncbi:uncharacterized protein LOC144922175 [Branchiostoma floridae x Branchiostoma belcheri]